MPGGLWSASQGHGVEFPPGGAKGGDAACHSTALSDTGTSLAVHEQGHVCTGSALEARVCPRKGSPNTLRRISLLVRPLTLTLLRALYNGDDVQDQE